MKLDASGTIVWQKTYGVAAGWDWAASIRQTTDNGYVVAGSVYSHLPGALGYYDLWVFKLDIDSNVTWQKSYGGSGDDAANSIKQTVEGGYIVAGATALASSGGIGATGDRFLVLKLDQNGNADWQTTYGGTGGEFACSARQTTDGGYVEAGVNGHAGDDFLVFKIDPDGNMDGCGFGRNTAAAASITSFSPAATGAAVSESTATVSASTSVSTDTSSRVTQICPFP